MAHSNLFAQFAQNVNTTIEAKQTQKYVKKLTQELIDPNGIEVIKIPSNRLIVKLRKGYQFFPKRLKVNQRKLDAKTFKHEVTLKLNGFYTSLECNEIKRKISALIEALNDSKMRRITVFNENIKELNRIRFITIETKRKQANRDKKGYRNKGSFPEKIQGNAENAEYCQPKRVKHEFTDYSDIKNIVSITINGKLIIGKKLNAVKLQKINHNRTSLQFPSLDCYQSTGQYGTSGAVFYLKCNTDHKLSKFATNGYLECALKLLSNGNVYAKLSQIPGLTDIKIGQFKLVNKVTEVNGQSILEKHYHYIDCENLLSRQFEAFQTTVKDKLNKTVDKTALLLDSDDVNKRKSKNIKQIRTNLRRMLERHTDDIDRIETMLTKTTRYPYGFLTGIVLTEANGNVTLAKLISLALKLGNNPTLESHLIKLFNHSKLTM